MPEPRRAGPDDAVTVASLLDAFNREYNTPTPGVEVLTSRLDSLLAGGDVIALEINVDGGDAEARRFYEQRGYSNTEPGTEEPLLYYYRELRG